MTATMTDPNELLALGWTEFKAIVDQEAKENVSAEVAEALRDPALTRRWYETLISTQKQVEGQLAAIAADIRSKQAEATVAITRLKDRIAELEAAERVNPVSVRKATIELKNASRDQLATTAKLQRWRASAIRFKVRVEDRLLEARAQLREHDAEFFTGYAAKERGRALARVAELERAIRKHRNAITVEDEPSSADDDLHRLI